MFVLRYVADDPKSLVKGRIMDESSPKRTSVDPICRELDMDFTPVISTLAGGLLTIAGGFLSQSILYRRQRAAESQSITLNKLEEIGRLANSIRDSGLQMSAVGVQTMLRDKDSTKEIEIEKSSADEFFLLVKLYAPFLIDQAASLIASERAIGEFVVRKLAELSVPGSNVEELLDELNHGAFRIRDSMKISHDAFMDSLSSKFVGYRL